MGWHADWASLDGEIHATQVPQLLSDLCKAVKERYDINPRSGTQPEFLIGDGTTSTNPSAADFSGLRRDKIDDVFDDIDAGISALSGELVTGTGCSVAYVDPDDKYAQYPPGTAWSSWANAAGATFPSDRRHSNPALYTYYKDILDYIYLFRATLTKQPESTKTKQAWPLLGSPVNPQAAWTAYLAGTPANSTTSADTITMTAWSQTYGGGWAYALAGQNARQIYNSQHIPDAGVHDSGELAIIRRYDLGLNMTVTGTAEYTVTVTGDDISVPMPALIGTFAVQRSNDTILLPHTWDDGGATEVRMQAFGGQPPTVPYYVTSGGPLGGNYLFMWAMLMSGKEWKDVTGDLTYIA